MPEKPQPGFYITGKKGFQIVFENRWCVSVQFGTTDYCDNYGIYVLTNEQAGERGSSTAECAVFNPENVRVEMPNEPQAITNRSKPRDVVELIKWASSQMDLA